jgi:hypothetical protein
MRTAVGVLFISLLAGSLSGSDSKLDRETLKGIDPLYIIVSVQTKDGLNGSQIEMDLDRHMRAAGIKVVRSDPHLPCLFVSANVLRHKDGSWIYEVSVSLNQAVTIAANNGPYMASTWSTSILASASSRDAPGFVRTDIETLTAKFIGAYLSVNRQ